MGSREAARAALVVVDALSAPLSSSRGEGGGKRVACERGGTHEVHVVVVGRLDGEGGGALGRLARGGAAQGRAANRRLGGEHEGVEREGGHRVGRGKVLRKVPLSATVARDVARQMAAKASLWLTARLLISGYGITAHAGVGFEGFTAGSIGPRKINC